MLRHGATAEILSGAEKTRRRLRGHEAPATPTPSTASTATSPSAIGPKHLALADLLKPRPKRSGGRKGSGRRQPETRKSITADTKRMMFPKVGKSGFVVDKIRG